MFEKEAEEWRNSLNYEIDNDTFNNIVIPCIEFGYNKGFEFGVKSNEKVNQIVDNEWHYVKDELPKESKKYYVYSKQWGIEVRKFFAEVGYFECRKNDVIAWKEIVLPELKGSE